MWEVEEGEEEDAEKWAVRQLYVGTLNRTNGAWVGPLPRDVTQVNPCKSNHPNKEKREPNLPQNCLEDGYGVEDELQLDAKQRNGGNETKNSKADMAKVSWRLMRYFLRILPRRAFCGSIACIKYRYKNQMVVSYGRGTIVWGALLSVETVRLVRGNPGTRLRATRSEKGQKVSPTHS